MEDMVSMIMVVVMMMMMIVMMKMLKMSSHRVMFTRQEILLREHGGRILSLRLLQGISLLSMVLVFVFVLSFVIVTAAIARYSPFITGACTCC